MQLFLDANILFSATWHEDAAAGLLWELARAGRCELLTSHLADEEARRNMARKRPDRIATTCSHPGSASRRSGYRRSSGFWPLALIGDSFRDTWDENWRWMVRNNEHGSAL